MPLHLIRKISPWSSATYAALDLTEVFCKGLCVPWYMMISVVIFVSLLGCVVFIALASQWLLALLPTIISLRFPPQVGLMLCFTHCNCVHLYDSNRLIVQKFESSICVPNPIDPNIYLSILPFSYIFEGLEICDDNPYNISLYNLVVYKYYTTYCLITCLWPTTFNYKLLKRRFFYNLLCKTALLC
jgi:hypothetical protein